MTWRLLAMSAGLLTAVVAGCGRSGPRDDLARSDVSGRPLDDATFNAGLDPTDKRIVALVSWLEGKGVALEYATSIEGDGGWWRVSRPKMSVEYDVVFSIRTFPSWASEAQMREALDINLAYQLNAAAHLAMSFGGLSGTHPDAQLPKSDDELPKVHGLPITEAVEKLFREYEAD